MSEIDVIELPPQEAGEVEAPLIAVRVTVEYQFGTRAAHGVSTIRFPAGALRSHVVAASGREAEKLAASTIRAVAVALGMGERR